MDSMYKTPDADLKNQNTLENNSGMKLDPVPAGIKGWSWGAFFLNWIWAISNKTWIGLFALVPYVGFFMVIILGIKGREWAWKNKRWDSIDDFNQSQRRWSMWGIGLIMIPLALGLIAAFIIPLIF